MFMDTAFYSLLLPLQQINKTPGDIGYVRACMLMYAALVYLETSLKLATVAAQFQIATRGGRSTTATISIYHPTNGKQEWIQLFAQDCQAAVGTSVNAAW